MRVDGRSRPPHLRTWSDGWRHLRFLLMFAPGKTLVSPGLALAALGLAGTALLGPGPRAVGGVVFDVNALAYACAAVLVGVQMVLLGGLAQVYGSTEGLTHRPLPRWTALLRLETAGAVGVTLGALGLVGSAAALEHWRRLGFGDLYPRGTVRLVLPSASLVALGALWLFTGFVGSLLTLRGVRETPTAASGPAAGRRERPAAGAPNQ